MPRQAYAPSSVYGLARSPLGSDSGSDSGDDDPHEVRKEHPLADFEAFARRRPGVDFTAPGDSLGNLELDCSYDWLTHMDRYVELYPEKVDQIKADNPIDLRVDVDSSPAALNPDQRKIYDTIVDQYNYEISPGDRPPQPQLLLNVDGEAGTGRTFTLLKACARPGRGNPVFRAAPVLRPQYRRQDPA